MAFQRIPCLHPVFCSNHNRFFQRLPSAVQMADTLSLAAARLQQRAASLLVRLSGFRQRVAIPDDMFFEVWTVFPDDEVSACRVKDVGMIWQRDLT